MKRNLFLLKKLVNSTNKSVKNHKLTLEFSSNPAWYAVQALPYLMDQGNESADNTFQRYYANTIASGIVEQNDAIKQVFESWQKFTPDALLSMLEKIRI